LNVVRFITCLVLLLASFSPSISQTSQKRTIAILNFDNNSISDREQLEPLKKGMADMLNTEMSQIESFKVVERERLQSVLSEISLGQTGTIDPATAQQVGKLLGAQTILLGSFVNMFGGNLRMDVRIVEVETGVTLKAVEETGKVDDLFEMVKKLTKKIAKYFDVELSKADKERLEKRKGTEKFDAALFYSKGIEFEDLALQYQKSGDQNKTKEMYQKALEMYQKAIDESPKYSDAKTRLQEIQQKLQSFQ
jgi:TolB-like protein